MADLPDALVRDKAKVTTATWGDPYEAPCTFDQAAQAPEGTKALALPISESSFTTRSAMNGRSGQ
jgi:hypothetical protein